MRIIICDICGGNVRSGDVRYITITKENPDNDSIQLPVMAERETCVHCAEAVKTYVQDMVNTIADMDKRRK